MRFKAKLAPEQVSLLHSIIVPMTRLHGSGGDTNSTNRSHATTSSSQKNHYVSSSFTRNGTILYFDTDHVRISSKGTNNVDGITCFVELNAKGYSSIFLDQRIESIAPNNAIVMEIDIQQLRIALKSVLQQGGGGGNNESNFALNDAQRYVVIKLAKRQNIPCICIDACRTGSTKNSQENYLHHKTSCIIQVHHAIPVRILRHTDMAHYLPPPIQQLPTVQLELVPSPYNLRTVIDRLKHISSTLYLEANTRGELTISTHTDGASIQTYFSKLTVRFDKDDDNDDDDNRRPNRKDTSKSTVTTARIKMDTKKLAASLQWQTTQQQQSSNQTMVSSALLCLIENEMVVIHVNINPINVGFFTYYIPVHYLSNDPYE